MRLSFAGESILLTGLSEAMSQQVIELVSPAFTGKRDASSRGEAVRLDVRVGEFHSPRLEREKPWRMPATLLFDESEQGCFRVLEHTGQKIVVLREARDDDAPLCLQVDASRRSWTVRTPPASLATARALARIAKYLLGCLTRSLGSLVLHASCVSVRDGALIFIGAKGGGKSSFMFCATAEMGARFVSDDILLCWRDPAGTFLCSGWPRRVGIPLSAINHGALRRRAAAANLRRKQELPDGWEDMEGEHRIPNERQRLMMDVDEYLATFCLKHETNARPRCIVMLEVDPDAGNSWTLEKAEHLRVREAFAEPKDLKLFTDYLALCPAGLGTSHQSGLETALEDLLTLKLTYGLQSLASFPLMWARIRRKLGEASMVCR